MSIHHHSSNDPRNALRGPFTAAHAHRRRSLQRDCARTQLHLIALRWNPDLAAELLRIERQHGESLRRLQRALKRQGATREVLQTLHPQMRASRMLVMALHLQLAPAQAIAVLKTVTAQGADRKLDQTREVSRG